MSITSLGKGFGLIKQLLDNTVTTEAIVATPPQKPAFKPSDNSAEYAVPESLGISSEMLMEYARELYEDKSVNVQDLLVLRNGKVVLEVGYGCWDINVWKNTFSQCKSITGMAIGLLLADGLVTLDSSLADIFGKKVPMLSRAKFRDITVRKLLTMSTQIIFNEAECMTTDNWVKAYFSSATYPGSVGSFTYNSLNSYMLAAIVHELTGKSMTEFLDERLFAPMGITNYYWEKCPKGIEKGGWGLYILPHDMAKLGQLMQDKGVWRGKRLLSEKYIDAATSKKIDTDQGIGNYDYGFQIWTSRSCDCFVFNGMLGQNMFCYRDSGITVVMNAGNADTFQQNSLFAITDKYFAKSFPATLPRNSKAERKLKKTVKELSSFHPRRERYLIERILRKRNIRQWSQQVCGEYTVTSKEAASVGIVPLLMQVVQNNYTKGTLGYRFEIDESGLCLCHLEKDAETKVHVGFDRPIVEEISPYGEKCLVATTGEFRYNEEDELVLKVKLDFLEFPYSRMMKFIFREKGLEVRYTETPGKALIENFEVDGFVGEIPEWITGLASSGAASFITKLASVFEETLYADKAQN